MVSRKNVKILNTKLEINDYVKLVQWAKNCGFSTKSDYQMLKEILHSCIGGLLVPSSSVKNIRRQPSKSRDSRPQSRSLSGIGHKPSDYDAYGHLKKRSERT